MLLLSYDKSSGVLSLTGNCSYYSEEYLYCSKQTQWYNRAAGCRPCSPSTRTGTGTRTSRATCRPWAETSRRSCPRRWRRARCCTRISSISRWLTMEGTTFSSNHPTQVSSIVTYVVCCVLPLREYTSTPPFIIIIPLRDISILPISPILPVLR